MYFGNEPGNLRTDSEPPTGCSKRLFSKAAASDEAKYFVPYVEPLSDARTTLADFFNTRLKQKTAQETCENRDPDPHMLLKHVKGLSGFDGTPERQDLFEKE